MKHWLAKLTITTYLAALGAGIACHAMNFGMGSHPAVYFFVWDMFCGWSAHETRYHLIGEGESGNYYKLSPAPWNTFSPYGDLERDQYDNMGNTHARIALNTLRHTDHEPIVRMVLVEESWPKKYNLSDQLWAARFDEPKVPQSYFWQKCIYDADGMVIKCNPDFLNHLHSVSVSNNPRLKADSVRGRPFFAVDPAERSNASIGTGTYMGESWLHPSAN